MEQPSSCKVRWGILGCADIALRWVIPAIQQSETGVVAAIASRDPRKAADAAQAHGIPIAAASYEQLIGLEEIDAVYIPLPNHLHCEWTVKAAQAGKHVLCEKPLSLNAAQAEEMAAACRKAQVHLAEAFMYRHHPRYEFLKETIRSGEIGEIRAFHGSFTFDISMRKNDVRFRSEFGGGAFYDDGCYPVSAARFLLGEEPEAVTFHSFRSSEHDGVDMMNSGLMEFPKGVGATLQFGMWCDGTNEITILGSKGSIYVPSAFYYDPPAETAVVVKSGGTTREERFPPLNHYMIQADDFGRSVLEGRQPLFGSADAVNNMRALEACIRSARERSRVPVESLSAGNESHGM
ncbi:Gfo/Idh/MocA family protein [Paenibacillus thermotolerans]|uniref:Gfo/Idh/MocA family protein n=1 Tax=Paenibacillus thermotolerans TaxID=3027807 RepID=UPI0023687818|nr:MULTISPECIES: Gfo/Idh/MocA family oxidoreductase [unclassified Paenibacillus]